MVTSTQSCSWRERQPARTCGLLKRDTDIGHVGPSQEGVKKINPSVFFSNLCSHSAPFGPIQPEASEQKHPVESLYKGQPLRGPERSTEARSRSGGIHRDYPACQVGEWALQENYS